MSSRLITFLRLFTALLVLTTTLPSSQRASARQLEPQPVQQTGIIQIRADAFGRTLAQDETSNLYSAPAVLLQPGESVSFQVTIPRDGVYTISFDMVAGAALNQPEGQFKIDGSYPLPDARQIVFPLFFQNSANQFPQDRYGNDALIRQVRRPLWTTVALRDANLSLEYPIKLQISQGQHTFEFKTAKAAMYLGSITIQEFSEYPAYSVYSQDNQAPESSGVLIELQAEFPTYKNDTSIRPVASRSLSVSPYDTNKLLLNTIGGDSWNTSGSTVYYEFNAPADGMYLITLRALQDTRNNFTVFRRITINGAVPFAQLNQVLFAYSNEWSNLTLGGASPYKIFLKQGLNVLGIEATNAPYHSAIEKIKKALVDINDLSLEIKKLTGNQVDRYKEWVLSDYIPDIRERLLAIADDLASDKEILLALNDSGASPEILTYQMAIDNIRFLANDPDKIPVYMNRFSQGSGSAAQLLGKLLPTLQSQPLALDKIFIHSPDRLPTENKVPLFTSLAESLKRFIYSFRPDPYQSIGASSDEIEVWVNRPRQYVDLLQSMTDNTFTKETGIKVKFSIMPDESKLVLANAAGIQPDVALGVSTNVPYELAIRNALKDLRSFNDFDSFIRIYSPGSLLSYIINDSVYAIPETQDFWVTYYRKDILDSLGLPVPKTWNEVLDILPELQRYGMNYNTTLSSGSGLKGYLVTAPYLFNYDAPLYNPDGFSTGLGSEEAINAIKFMAESFTIYGMPLTTSSFYDSFRYGSLPVGISNFETYIKLITAAPELNGLWGIDLYPATTLADGTQLHYATGSAQASLMFANTDRPEDSWKFMKWWMSTETQVEFQEQLILNYGPEYLWNSANLEAFQYLQIPDEHKRVILEQWQWMQEPVKLPGSYMQERELSNAWNKIVFDGVNPRVAIDKAIIIINREITRKMEEFGYLKNGKKVKEFKIPTIETVKRWMDNAK